MHTCKKAEEEDKAGFVCPKGSTRGVFSKHAHPEDCRQYYICISGKPREYGCPVGSVFKITTDGNDGKCSDPADVPECANYYGDLTFQPQELVRAGVDPEAVGFKPAPGRVRVINRPSNVASRVKPVARRPRPTEDPITESLLEELLGNYLTTFDSNFDFIIFFYTCQVMVHKKLNFHRRSNLHYKQDLPPPPLDPHLHPGSDLDQAQFKLYQK